MAPAVVAAVACGVLLWQWPGPVAGIAMAVAAVVVILGFAVYAAGRLSEHVLEVAELLHDAVGREPEAPDSARGIDELFRMEYELKELLARQQDLAQLRRSELETLNERFAAVIEGMQEGVVLLDRRFNVLTANSAARRILGMTPDGGEALSLKDITLPGDDADDADALLRFKSDIDRDSRIYEPRMSPFTGAAGAVEGYVMVFWDVTEERRFEESRRRFISMLSHQLKTPMTSLTMSISLLNEKLRGSTPAADEMLNMARSDCDALSSLITELIGASRDTPAGLSLSLRRNDLGAVLSAAMKQFASQAEKKGVALDLDLSAPVFAQVDPIKFPWAVANIVRNALRHTPSGGRISLRMTAENDSAHITISDDGPGIEKDKIKHVFEPYTSLNENPTPDSMGLGLTIAREIVEAHNGAIEVKSEPGRGATFTITLPLA